MFVAKEIQSGWFTLHKLANMRRSGVGKPRPLLDQEKLDLLRGAGSALPLVGTLQTPSSEKILSDEGAGRAPGIPGGLHVARGGALIDFRIPEWRLCSCCAYADQFLADLI
ncbi:hypothetical protein DPMN_141179 [Dreissena polymorpha]|uniref:Uncharacterized protein n=1 Tax=Dreissena polymorpha TaxID=45954 RepID=A0A9D4G8Z7_DREPO|nr:hypothetical protein DPMN_141179 [Dreissena polymorpha]